MAAPPMAVGAEQALVFFALSFLYLLGYDERFSDGEAPPPKSRGHRKLRGKMPMTRTTSPITQLDVSTESDVPSDM